MLCEKCGKNNATVLYTQIINGKKSSLNLCSACSSGESIFDNFGSLLSFGTRTDARQTVCPICGMTLSEFARKGKMGCGKCYETFRAQAKSMLQKIHGTSVHTETKNEAPAPETKKEEKSELDILKDNLKEAINTENYEEAAKIRDEIRAIKDILGDTPLKSAPRRVSDE